MTIKKGGYSLDNECSLSQGGRLFTTKFQNGYNKP